MTIEQGVQMTEGERGSLNCLLYRCKEEKLELRLRVYHDGAVYLEVFERSVMLDKYMIESKDSFGNIFINAQKAIEATKRS